MKDFSETVQLNKRMFTAGSVILSPSVSPNFLPSTHPPPHFSLDRYIDHLLNPLQRTYMCMYSFPGGASGEPTCQCRRCKRCGFDPWVGKSPWRRKMAPHSTALAWIPHSTALAWRILWTEEPVGLQSMGSQKVRLKQLSTHAHAHNNSLCCTVETNTL